MTRPIVYRKTGIGLKSHTNAYARAYYTKFLKKSRDDRKNRGRDWVSVFRVQTRKSARNRGLEFAADVTTAYMHEIFREQRGRCFYTGIRFRHGERTFRGMRQASLDRIDPGKGYVRGNVVWCLTAINYLKNDYAEGDIMSLLEEIRANRPAPKM